MQELWHLVSDVGHLSENEVMLLVLGLVDVVIHDAVANGDHITFVISAVALTAIDRFLSPKSPARQALEARAGGGDGDRAGGGRVADLT